MSKEKEDSDAERRTWQNWAQEELREFRKGDEIRFDGYRLIEFVSKSGGRGRRREAREIVLFAVLDQIWQLNRVPESKRRGQRRGRRLPRLDSIAQAVLGRDATPEEFLERLRVLQRDRKGRV